MRAFRLFVPLSVAAMLMMAHAARAGEEKIGVDKLPKAVLDAAKAKYPGAEITGAAKEDEDGKTVYEVTLKNEGQQIEVIVSPEGKIVLVEKTIAPKDVPKAVRKAAREKHPKCKIKKAEELSKDDKITSYELVVVTPENKTWEVVFDPSGKFIKEEDKSKAKDDEKAESVGKDAK